MAKDKEQIKKEIEAFKLEHKGDYPDYYIGITNNPERRMDENLQAIQEHLSKGEFTKGAPVYIEECESRDHAVEIETYFQDEKGMEKFNPGSRGVSESKFIYCYKMDEDNKRVILNESSPAAKEIRRGIDAMKSLGDFAKEKLK